MRKLLSIALVLLVFSGSVGVPLYRHTCMHEQITFHTLFTGSNHCEKEQAIPVQPEKHSCCAVPQKVQISKESCCTENVTRLALSFSFFEPGQQLLATIPQPLPSVEQVLPYTIIFPTETVMRCAGNSDPPPLSGRERLQANCILRL